jgi:iron complex transport system permease protein
MRTSAKIGILCLVAIVLAMLDLLSGSGGMGIPEYVIFIKIRLPRMLTAILAGSCLSLAGLQMQSIFRNPLADPHIMGISAGAGTGAAIAIIIAGASISGFSIVLAAFLGAMAAFVLIMAVASRISSTYTLLIFGVMLGFVFSAITSILEYSANEESLKIFYNWSAGSFLGTRPMDILIMLVALAIGIFLAGVNSRGLDIALFGDEYASLAGASIFRIRNMAMAGSCVMTGAVTAFCGPIGFVGIVAPHIARFALGSSVHRKVIPATMLVGASLSLIADVLSQVFSSPLPVGSTMAIIGIPLILIILCSKPSI